MTNYYVDDAGSDTNPYDTKAKAASSLELLISGLATAGTPLSDADTVYVLEGHSFIRGDSSANTITVAETLDTGCRIIGVADAVPATALASTKPVEGNSNNADSIKLNGSFYMRNMHLNHTSTGSSGSNQVRFMTTNNSAQTQVFEDCKFQTIGSQASSGYEFGPSGHNGGCNEATFINCEFLQADNSGGTTPMEFFNVDVLFRGCTVSATTITIATLCRGGNEENATVVFENCDLGTAAITALVDVSQTNRKGHYIFKNCLIGASTSATTGTEQGSGGMTVEIHNTDDSSGTNYRYEKHCYTGTITSDNANYVASGASDGTTTISHSFVTDGTSNLNRPLIGPEISQWVEGDGTGLTCTVDFCHDANLTGGDLDNGDIWLELTYLASASNPKGSTVTNRVEIPFGTVADHSTAQSGEWTVASMTTKNTQQMSVNFTPAQPGYVQARVKMALASKTIYVDPRLVITTT
mgnify:CR=1 FL=1|tara:strand:+ start:2727 stop:4130 length:1404 start_codon:yes stop_codon:yes gene_type:complete